MKTNYISKVKTAILTISITIFIPYLNKKLTFTYQAKDFKNKEESILNESVRVLNECFDLENKDKRSLNKLID